MNEERNYLAEMSRLRAKYPMVSFLSKGKHGVGHSITVRIRASKQDVGALEARVLDGKTRWSRTYVDLFDVEQAIMHELGLVIEKPRANNYALALGKGMLKELDGYCDWITGHYLLAHIPATEGTAFWSGWLRFAQWKGREPNRREWSADNRRKLHAGGHYAWLVMVDPEHNRMKLYYSGPGTKRPYATKWFPMMAEELHSQLVEVSAHADKWRWRDLEIAEVEGRGEGVVVEQISPRQARRLKLRAKKQAIEAAENDRYEQERQQWIKEETKAKMDEWTDPNSPDGWSGDLNKRYADD